MRLRLHVAALDLLRELDLLGGGQQRVAAGLAQEELEGVGGRLERRRRQRRGRGSGLLALAVVDELDPPLLEHPVHRVDLERRRARADRGSRPALRSARSRPALRPRRAAGALPSGRHCRSRRSVLPSSSGTSVYPPPRAIETRSRKKVEFVALVATPPPRRTSTLDNRRSVKLAEIRKSASQIAPFSFVPPLVGPRETG